jgi:dihydrofolate reductase
MRRVRYGVGMSLNGFIADSTGGTDFLVSDSGYDPGPFFASIDTVLMGRRTYELAVQLGMRAYPGLRNIVISSTLDAAAYAEVEVLRDTTSVSSLRDADGKDIWLCGGGVLLASLLAADLVDTIEVGVSPVLLCGRGTPMLADAAGLPPSIRLELTAHRGLSTGLLILEYDVRRDAGASRQ